MRRHAKRKWVYDLVWLVVIAGVVILAELVLHGFRGGSHPIAAWLVRVFERIFTPFGHWLTGTSERALLAMIAVLDIPMTLLLMWAVDVAAFPIKPEYRRYVFVAVWTSLLVGQYFVITWVRQGAGF